MIINNTIQAVTGAYASSTSSNVKAKAKSNETVNAKDEIVLSSEAQNFSATLQQLKGRNDVRQDKVDYYAQQIQSGNYTVEANDIADKMLQMRY